MARGSGVDLLSVAAAGQRQNPLPFGAVIERMEPPDFVEIAGKARLGRNKR